MKYFIVSSLLNSKLLLMLCVVFAPALSIKAYAGEQSQAVGLSWVLQQTLDNNPELSLYPYQFRLSDARVLKAQQAPLPTLSLEAENLWGGGEFEGSDQAEYTLTLGQTLEMGGKREGRVAYATAASKLKQAEYEQARLQVMVETSRRYYQVLALQGMQVWMQQRIETEESALNIINQRAKAGAVGKADQSKMQLRLLKSKALAAQLNGHFRLAKSKLAAMWANKPTFTAVHGRISQIPDVPGAALILSMLSQAPAIKLQQTSLRLSDAKLQLAIANTSSDINLGVGLKHAEASGDQAAVLSLSMPIGKPNRSSVLEARAARALSQQQADQLRQQLQLNLLAIQQNLLNQHHYTQAISQQLLPQAKQLLDDIEAGYALGRYSVLQWVDAQKELYDLQRELIQSQRSIFLILLELEAITGQSLSQFTSTITANSSAYSNSK